jgi:RimJ/RimL family protein N-acetyltransferase
MNPAWRLQTGRLLLTPVGWTDLADLVALKGDPRAYAVMLGGVRSPVAVAEELAQEMADWSRLGYGMWAIRHSGTDQFVGIVGLQARPDGRGVGLRFALVPSGQGRGFASEAAGAALRFGHDRVSLPRIVAIARDDNVSSRQVLGAIGMSQCDVFLRDGVPMLVFQSSRTTAGTTQPI